MNPISKQSVVVAVAALVLVASAGFVQAKPVCLSAGPLAFAFNKVKLPKKPGDAKSLEGVFFNTGNSVPYPASGSIVRRGNGDLYIALMVHDANNDFTIAWIAAPETLAGSADFDNDGDFDKDNGTLPLVPLDCSTITFN